MVVVMLAVRGVSRGPLRLGTPQEVKKNSFILIFDVEKKYLC